MLFKCFPLVAAYVETETKLYMQNRSDAIAQIKKEYRDLYSLVGRKADALLSDLCHRHNFSIDELSDADIYFIMGDHYYD